MEIKNIEKILGRKIYQDLIDDSKKLNFSKDRILITGSGGSIGERLTSFFDEIGVDYLATDVHNMDVTKIEQFPEEDFTHVINIAGAKHAPAGEECVESAVEINTIGVLNLIKKYPNAHHVLCSTCKACNPETVYGATKLISERLILNKGGSVCRFYNVVETSGNVFEIWRNSEDPILVMNSCNRFFISLDEAVSLLMFSSRHKGRFMIDTPNIRSMGDIANSLYPERAKILCSPRRGDRVSEKIYADHEYVSRKIHDKINNIVSPND
jgi:FlaA1/EpsC-like NDP-sugar epimerase